MQVKFIELGLRATGQSRKEIFLGRAFRVIPSVLVRSQVLRNNLGVCFLPAADLTDEWASLWNGIPVLVGPHPSQRGEPCSGRDSALWNERLGGWVFHAKVRPESETVRQLVAEVWLDESRIEEVVGLRAVLESLEAGRSVELSTGFPAELVAEQGNFHGTVYEAVMHPAGADHLVISTEMRGACSVSDGCGLGVNKFEGAPPMAKEQGVAEVEVEAPKPPVADKAIRTGGIKAALSRVADLFSPLKREPLSWEETVAQNVARELEMRNALPASDQDRQTKIRCDLQEAYGSKGEVIVADVYSDNKEVVFWLMTPLGSSPQGPEYYRVTFTEATDGGFTFSEPVTVQRKTVYEPVANAEPVQAGNSTTQTEKDCGCVQQSASQEEATMTKENKEGEGAGGAKGIEDSIAALTQAVQSLSTKVDAIQKAAETDPNPSIAGLKKTVGELVSKFDTMKGVTETAVQERAREREALVVALAGNYRVPFTLPDLEAKPLEELRKLAQMASAEDYSGKGGPRSANSSEGQRFMQPVPYWEKSDAKDQKGGK